MWWARLPLVMSMSLPKSNDDDNVSIYLANETKLASDSLDYTPASCSDDDLCLAIDPSLDLDDDFPCCCNGVRTLLMLSSTSVPAFGGSMARVNGICYYDHSIWYYKPL